MSRFQSRLFQLFSPQLHLLHPAKTLGASEEVRILKIWRGWSILFRELIRSLLNNQPRKSGKRHFRKLALSNLKDNRLAHRYRYRLVRNLVAIGTNRALFDHAKRL